jgi:carboxypeptidase C (cathepsin A)
MCFYVVFQDSGDQVHDEPGVAADLLDFMQEFQKARPHLADREFFVTGESYGVSGNLCVSV